MTDIDKRIDEIMEIVEDCKDYENPPYYNDVRSYLISAGHVILELQAQVVERDNLVQTLGQALEHLNHNAKVSRAEMGLATFGADEAIVAWKAYLTKTEVK